MFAVSYKMADDIDDLLDEVEEQFVKKTSNQANPQYRVKNNSNQSSNR